MMRVSFSVPGRSGGALALIQDSPFDRTILSNDSDPDGDDLTAESASGATRGNLSIKSEGDDCVIHHRFNTSGLTALRI